MNFWDNLRQRLEQVRGLGAIGFGDISGIIFNINFLVLFSISD